MPSLDLTLRIKRLEHATGLELPRYETAQAAGLDLRAAVPTDAPLILAPMQRAAVPTGLILAIPDGFEGQVRPRSGLALKFGLTVANAPGTIDADYRGEVKVLLINLGADAVTIARGDRIAQLVLAPVARARVREHIVLEDTGRGSGGFGSTGV
jgi:dUTP pyrophosphatase